MQPEELLYAKTHEWAGIKKDATGAAVATIGISAFAIEALTDLVFLQLPEVGRELKAGETFGEIESVKAVSDLYSPLSGQVTEVNTPLASHLETLNEDPYNAGWLIKLKVNDDGAKAQLLDYAAYQKQCAEEGH